MRGVERCCGSRRAAAASEALLGRTVLVLAPRVRRRRSSSESWRSGCGSNGTPRQEAEAHAARDGQTRSVQVDASALDLEASDEIRLTCGKSSLVLRRDGTVIVRGVKIVSRASQSNKIRGGTVSIN